MGIEMWIGAETSGESATFRSLLSELRKLIEMS